MSHRFGDVRQVAYVVNDIQKAMRHWIDVLGIGPFFYLERLSSPHSTYRGKPTPVEISLAFSQSGPIQIELIQQHNDAPSQFREFLDAGLEGQHHLAFWTHKFDEDMNRYLLEGFEVLSTAQLPPNRNVFLTAQGHPGTMIEISEISGPKGRFFEKVAERAAAWDGKDPIRKISAMTPDAL